MVFRMNLTYYIQAYARNQTDNRLQLSVNFEQYISWHANALPTSENRAH